MFLTLLYIERTIFAPYISVLKLNRLEHISSNTFFWNKFLLLSFPKVCDYTQLVYCSKKTSCHYRSYTQQVGQNLSGHIRNNITFGTEWKFGELLNFMRLVLFLVVLDKKPNHDLPRLYPFHAYLLTVFSPPILFLWKRAFKLLIVQQAFALHFCFVRIFVSLYSRMGQVKFLEDSLGEVGA